MISVCIATYNGAKYIKQQLESILSQIGNNDEIIISDDESVDKTVEIIKSINDSRIKILIHKKENSEILKMKSGSFMAVSQNFENALNNAKGDVIFLSDQDDYWLPNKVNTCLSALEENDIVMSNYSIAGENLDVKIESFYAHSPISKYLLVNIARSSFLGCCMAFRKCVLDYVLPFPKNLIGHDFWIGCLGVRNFRFLFIQAPLLLYRRTDSNVSTASAKSKNSLIYKIYYRLVFLKKLKLHIRNKTTKR